MDNNLSIDIVGINLKNPLIVASGFLGLSQSIFNRLINLGAGAIVSKSISLLPREGYKNPTIVPINTNSLYQCYWIGKPRIRLFSI